MANKAQEKLCSVLRRDGTTHAMHADMQTREELNEMIRLHDFEALDSSIIETVLPS